jgi:hypothetical protein
MGGRARLFFMIFVVSLLLGSNIYIYLSLSRENLELRSRLRLKEAEYYDLAQSYRSLHEMYVKLQEDYNRLSEQNRNLSSTISELKLMYDRLYVSYRDVLEANRNLTNALETIANKLVVPYNYTLLGYYDFMDRFIFAYSDEMKKYVYNVTGGWNGSEDDFLSDLYKIYRRWRSDFTFMMPPPSENLKFISVGTWWRPETPMGDRYLKEVRNVDVMDVPVVGAQISFRHRKGVCWDYATVLASLYYAYYDLSGRWLPTGYLSIGFKDRGGHHGCVLIKEGGDRIAIIDWDPITVEDGKVRFLPFKEAKRLHEEYWGSGLSYDGVQRRTREKPFVVNNFPSEEEFYRWLTEEFS